RRERRKAVKRAALMPLPAQCASELSESCVQPPLSTIGTAGVDGERYTAVFAGSRMLPNHRFILQLGVRFGSKADMGECLLSAKSGHFVSRLLNHFIRSEQQRLRYFEPECPGGLEIDADVETRRLLEWQVSRLVSPQNTIDKRGCAIVNFIKVWGVGRQTAIAYVVRPLVGGRQPMFGSKFVDPSAIEEGEYIRDHENCVRWVAHHACEGFVKIFRLTHGEWLHPNPDCPCGVSDSLVSQRHAQIAFVKEHGDGAQLWHHVFEQFE